MKRKKMKTRYRRFPFVSDLGGIKSAIGELRGMGYPRQPKLNTSITPEADANSPSYDEAWFVETIKGKIAGHAENGMEYPFYGERLFDEPLIGFIRGDDPIFHELKEIIVPHHFPPEEIMAWQAKKNTVDLPAAEEVGVV